MFAPAATPKSHLGRYRLLAPTAGVKVSPLCLGAMNFGDGWYVEYLPYISKHNITYTKTGKNASANATKRLLSRSWIHTTRTEVTSSTRMHITNQSVLNIPKGSNH